MSFQVLYPTNLYDVGVLVFGDLVMINKAGLCIVSFSTWIAGGLLKLKREMSELRAHVKAATT